MESTTNMEKTNYGVLVEKLESFYASKTRLKNEVNKRRDDFNHLKAHLGNWNFSYNFPNLEAEINTMIGTWGATASLQQLLETLQVLKQKIDEVDKAIVSTKKEQQSLLQLPDRHGRKAVTDKIALFLTNAPNIGLQSIDKVCNNIIPQIHTMIEGVKSGFSEEGAKVDFIQKEARKLQSRVNQYEDYVDRFNMKQLCTGAAQLASQVLQSPNRLHPEADADRLSKANRLLDQCMQQFEAEDNLFKDLLSSLEAERRKVWEEDYYDFNVILSRGAYNEITPASQLKTQITAAKTKRLNEIDLALQNFSDKIKNVFAQEIQSMYDEFHSRKELDRLVAKMEQMSAEERKKLIIRIAVIVAVIIFLAAIILTETWPYFLAAAVVIGIIVAYFHFR